MRNLFATSPAVGTALRNGIGFLREKKAPEPEISAERLLEWVLGKTRVELYLEAEKKISDSAQEQFSALLEKRAAHYPLQYLLGTAEFRTISLEVGEGCLIPRPETELLVEDVFVRMERKNEKLHVLDIGTGSGNIAISLAKERPEWTIVGTDISPEALRYARKNAKTNGVSARISFEEYDLFSPASKFDAVVSNPPYLSSRDFLNLQKEVTFEPRAALDGGEDGFKFYRRIIPSAEKFLKKGGMIFFEMGIGQAEAVSAELKANGFGEIEILKDYNGIERVISAKYRNRPKDTIGPVPN